MAKSAKRVGKTISKLTKKKFQIHTYYFPTYQSYVFLA